MAFGTKSSCPGASRSVTDVSRSRSRPALTPTVTPLALLGPRVEREGPREGRLARAVGVLLIRAPPSLTAPDACIRRPISVDLPASTWPRTTRCRRRGAAANAATSEGGGRLRDGADDDPPPPLAATAPRAPPRTRRRSRRGGAGSPPRGRSGASRGRRRRGKGCRRRRPAARPAEGAAGKPGARPRGTPSPGRGSSDALLRRVRAHLRRHRARGFAAERGPGGFFALNPRAVSAAEDPFFGFASDPVSYAPNPSSQSSSSSSSSSYSS